MEVKSTMWMATSNSARRVTILKEVYHRYYLVQDQGGRTYTVPSSKLFPTRRLALKYSLTRSIATHG